MSHFPDPVTLPDSVLKARKERNRQMFRSVIFGTSIRCLIIIAEFIGVALFDSSALLMDALSSSIDVVFSILLLFFIKLAQRPPDSNHPLGHGRYEPLAGVQLGLALVVVGIGMFIQQTFHLTTVQHGELDSRVWIIPVGAVILLEVSYRMLMHTARKFNSPALVSDAAHYRIDSLTSLVAAISLVIAAYIPAWSLFIDHIGAIVIAILMVMIGLFAARGNLNQLLDAVPDEEYFVLVKKAAKRVPGVFDTEKIRIQQYGPDAHIDIDIEVEPTLSVEEAHKISQNVRAEIQKDWPFVRDVIVHIEPYYPGDH